jgi:Fe-S-cluster containining protein
MTERPDTEHLDVGEILQGFLYSYRQLDVNALKVFEASANLYALLELLIAKGVIGIEELDQRRRGVEARLTKSFQEAEIGVAIQTPEIDKYALPEEPKVNCWERHSVCKSVCCKLVFSLAWQDIQEGIRWNVGRPFICAKGADGYCVYLDRENHKCRIYDIRPAACRAFDCSDDSRIWADFEKMIINPELLQGDGLLSPTQPMAKRQIGPLAERSDSDQAAGKPGSSGQSAI